MKFSKNIMVEENLNRIVKLTFCGIFIAGITIISISSIRFTYLDYPIHDMEAVEVVNSSLIANSINPFSSESFPKNVSCYGPFYYLFSSVFTTNNNFNVNRENLRKFFWVCTILAAITLSLSLIYDNTPTLLACLCGLLLLVNLGFCGNELGSKPGGFGFLLFFTGLVIPYWRRFSLISSIAGSLLIIFAFLSKQYFLFGLPILLSYIFLFRKKINAIIAAIISIICMYLFLILYEYYFNNTLGVFSKSNLSLTTNESYNGYFKYLFNNIYNGGIIYLILFLIFLFTLYINIQYRCSIKTIIYSRIFYIFYITTLSLLFYMFVLGRCSGNGFIYVPHTFLAFLIWFVFHNLAKFSTKSNNIEFFSYILCILLLIISLYTYLLPKWTQSKKENMKEWAKIEKIIGQHENVLSHRLITSVLLQQGKDYYDLGHLKYARNFVGCRGIIGIDSIGSCKNEAILINKIEQYKIDMREKLQNGKYDLVIINKKKDNRYGGTYFKVTDKEMKKYGYSFYDEIVVNTLISKDNVKIWIKR